MPKILIKQSVRLPQEDYDALQQLAEEWETLAPCGRTAGQPTWRTLIKLIARGKFLLLRRTTQPNVYVMQDKEGQLLLQVHIIGHERKHG